MSRHIAQYEIKPSQMTGTLIPRNVVEEPLPSPDHIPRATF